MNNIRLQKNAKSRLPYFGCKLRRWPACSSPDDHDSPRKNHCHSRRMQNRQAIYEWVVTRINNPLSNAMFPSQQPHTSSSQTFERRIDELGRREFLSNFKRPRARTNVLYKHSRFKSKRIGLRWGHVCNDYEIKCRKARQSVILQPKAVFFC